MTNLDDDDDNSNNNNNNNNSVIKAGFIIIPEKTIKVRIKPMRTGLFPKRKNIRSWRL